VDLEAYRPERGLAGHDLARAHHDARDHAAAVIQLIERLGPGAALGEPSAVRALAQLAESQLRAELAAEHYRREAKQWFALYNEALEQMAQMRGESEARLARERAGMEAERAALASAAQVAAEGTAALMRTRRFRLAQALARPLDRLRGRLPRL
jgi:hypothetical protein